MNRQPLDYVEVQSAYRGDRSAAILGHILCSISGAIMGSAFTIAVLLLKS